MYIKIDNKWLLFSVSKPCYAARFGGFQGCSGGVLLSRLVDLLCRDIVLLSRGVVWL